MPLGYPGEKAVNNLVTDSHGMAESIAGGMTHQMMLFVLQLAVIIFAARGVGDTFRRRFGLPSVLGELAAGMIIGPFALGGLSIGGFGPLFGSGAFGFPVTSELYGLATLASIVLLFFAGLETDLVAFLRYSFVGSLVGVGGVLAAFTSGAYCAVWFGVAESMADPPALFLGAVSTATSVGITARILAEKRKFDSPEGVTILAGAVVDDVLCVLVLAMAVGISKVTDVGGTVPWAQLGRLAGETMLFWVGSMVISLFSAPFVARVLKASGSPELMASVSFGLALFLAGVTESVGLAMIIGAYVTGLAFSRTDLVEVIQEELQGLYNVVVPVFFCVMGMLVDFHAMKGAVLFGIVYSMVAVAAKVIGCAIPAWMTRFNLRGSLRVGIGMLPRGEVALVVAGVGLASGILETRVFGVAVMMTAVTTLIAPPILMAILDDKSGLKPWAQELETDRTEVICLPMPAPELAELVGERIVRGFRTEGFFVHRLSVDTFNYRFRLDSMILSLVVENSDVRLYADPQHVDIARIMALEELIQLKGLADACEQIDNLQSLQGTLAAGLFGGAAETPSGASNHDEST